MSKKSVKLESHTSFLLTCQHEHLIPKGMQHKNKITIEDEIFKRRCKKMLDNLSSKSLVMTRKWMLKEKSKIDDAIKRTTGDLLKATGNMHYREMIDDINHACDHLRGELSGTKMEKLEKLRDSQTPMRQPVINNPELQHEPRHKNRRARKHKRKRSRRYKDKLRRAKLLRKEDELKLLLQNVDLPPSDRFSPFDNTNYSMSETEKEVCAKGLKFVPSVKRVDVNKKHEEFHSFARSLRLAVYFYRRGTLENNDYVQYPWSKKSKWEPAVGINIQLEEYLKLVQADMFNPRNTREVSDNMTLEQRQCLRELSQWNKDASNPRMFRIQDKGARLAIESKVRYTSKVLDYLEDQNTFREDTYDMSNENKVKVAEWAKRWCDQNVIDEDVKTWVTPDEVRPAKVHANLKAHKGNVPYRSIISSRGSATENLARWTEFQLKAPSMKHSAYLKDTTSLLKFIEDVNVRKGPLDQITTVLTTRDVVNYYPSCDTRKCLQAISKVLDEREGDSLIDKQCILEAVELTMTSNNCTFLERHFTQIDGATIGGPNSGSVTDIFGAEYIDQKIYQDCPYNVSEYKRYRDDTIDISINSTIEEQQAITTWLNENVYKGKIKFELNCNQSSVEFLDIKLNLIDGILMTECYSKPTDIHQYLRPDSCHPSHISKGIPKSVALRIRRNCSDRYEEDEKFVSCLREYKGYFMTSGYTEVQVDNAFCQMANVKRKDLLKETRKWKKKNTGAKKYRFITDHEPAFPCIKSILLKHQHILKNNRELANVFPRGARDFQISERRGSPNIKELLAPSSIRYNANEEENPGSGPCDGQCVYCDLLRRNKSDVFTSAQTGKTYKIRQKIDCKSSNVVYLASCTLCRGKQGVGYCTTSLKERISNYKSHHKKKVISCGISEHFQEPDHEFERDFQIVPIVRLMNPPATQLKRKELLEEFELYWQDNLLTAEPHGMNKLVEIERARVKIRNRKKK